MKVLRYSRGYVIRGKGLLGDEKLLRDKRGIVISEVVISEEFLRRKRTSLAGKKVLFVQTEVRCKRVRYKRTRLYKP